MHHLMKNKLAEEYGAMVLVDDCHGEGVLGEVVEGLLIISNFKARLISKSVRFQRHSAFKEESSLERK